MDSTGTNREPFRWTATVQRQRDGQTVDLPIETHWSPLSAVGGHEAVAQAAAAMATVNSSKDPARRDLYLPVCASPGRGGLK